LGGAVGGDGVPGAGGGMVERGRADGRMLEQAGER